MMTPEERAKRAAELEALSDDELAKLREAAHRKRTEELEGQLRKARVMLAVAEEEFGAGRAVLVRGDGGAVVLHMPTRNERVAAENVHLNDKVKASTQREARERLIRQCLYWPTADEWEQMAQAYPNMVAGVSLACLQLGKASAEEEEGK